MATKKSKNRITDGQKQRYSDYLKSNKWKSIRRKIIERDKRTCTSCGKMASDTNSISNFDVHHINYKYIFKEEENLECLRLVCRSCHDNITKAQRKGRKKRAERKGITVSIDINMFNENFKSLHKISDKAEMLLRMSKNFPFINEEFNKCFNAIIEKLNKRQLKE